MQYCVISFLCNAMQCNEKGDTFYRGTDACVFVYDITDAQTLQNIDDWRKTFIEKASDTTAVEFKFALLGNKSDLSSQRAVDTAKGRAFAEERNMLFYETSAKENIGLKDAFMALAIAVSAEPMPAFYSEETAKKIELEEQRVDGSGAACTCTLI